MGARAKVAAVAVKHDAKKRGKLVARHQAILAPGETITATLSAVAPDTSQPSVFFSAGLGGVVGYLIGKAVDRPKAQARSMAIRAHLGGPFSQFPESKNGYTIATTQLRVLIFDGKAKELVSEGPISGMRISSLDHGSDLSSIIFTDGNEHIAVTSVRGHTRGVESFVGIFPGAMSTGSRPAMAVAHSGAGGVFEF